MISLIIRKHFFLTIKRPNNIFLWLNYIFRLKEALVCRQNEKESILRHLVKGKSLKVNMVFILSNLIQS